MLVAIENNVLSNRNHSKSSNIIKYWTSFLKFLWIFDSVRSKGSGFGYRRLFNYGFTVFGSTIHHLPPCLPVTPPFCARFLFFICPLILRFMSCHIFFKTRRRLFCPVVFWRSGFFGSTQHNNHSAIQHTLAGLFCHPLSHKTSGKIIFLLIKYRDIF